LPPDKRSAAIAWAQQARACVTYMFAIDCVVQDDGREGALQPQLAIAF